MSTPHDLIRAIVDEDFVAAKEITNNLVFAAVSDELEVAKMEVAANLFDDCETCGDDVSEGLMSANRYGGGKPNTKDFDKDGKIESPKDEVHGSHINAAVKAGRLTPSAASETKNKGKYR